MLMLIMVMALVVGSSRVNGHTTLSNYIIIYSANAYIANTTAIFIIITHYRYYIYLFINILLPLLVELLLVIVV